MKKIYFLAFVFVHFVNAQISLPYVNNFNNPSSDENWNHYAISGIDDWGRGVTSGSINTTDLAWETKLGGTPSFSSNMVLESPTFDLTDTDLSNYVLSFKYKSYINVGNFYLEYTIDNGTSWLLLNPATTFKKNWQSTSGFSTSTTNFLNSVINVSFLQGNSKVKFRYRLNTLSYGNGYGFVVDDFSILPEYYNIYASTGSPIEITPLCSQFTTITSLNFQNQYNEYYAIVTNYYFSNDMILDDTDTMIGSMQNITKGTVLDINKTFTTPPNLLPGQYYILYKHDFTNQLNENDENDNVGFCSVVVKPIFNVPYSNDFENEDANWKTKTDVSTTLEIWQRGSGTRHHIEKAHSGSSAWHTSNSIKQHPNTTFQSVESPYFNLSSISQPLVLSFWYKVGYSDSGNSKVQYSSNCSDSWKDLYTIPQNTSDDWEILNIPIISSISSETNIKFRITYKVSSEGIIFDDFYIGPLKADLSMEQIYSNKRYTSSNTVADVLKCQIRNAGSDLLQSCITKFYWSTDNQLDTNDVVLGEQSITSIIGDNIGKWMSFSYTKPTLLSGNYYIIYVIDPTNQVDEIRENNNIGVIPIEQLSTYGFPYYNDFEVESDNWTHEATLGQDEWENGTPQGIVLNTAFSGSKAWVSKLSVGVSSMSRMHLYTPTFNLSTAKNPVLEFEMKLDNYVLCYCFELTLNMSYSTDNGATWNQLIPVNNSYSKWAKSMGYDSSTGLDSDGSSAATEKMFSKSEYSFINHKTYNSRDVDRNTKYIIDISQLKNETNIRFRYNLSTLLNDGSSGNAQNSIASGRSGILEGAMIDNFQIREAEIDLNVPYVKNIYLSALAKKLNFSIDVKNSGNYISNASDIKFYLSNDISFNSGDYYIGNADLAQIRPEFKSHEILELTLPYNLSDYKYLIYVIDDANTNFETNETNNQGYWDLGLSGVSSFPFLENFEGDVINGWNGYAYVNFTSNVLTNYRVPNRIPIPLENNIDIKFYNGALRTENVPSGSSSVIPLFYIQSPTFNFSTYNSSEPLVMAFDIVSVGKGSTNGTNMEYSIDGGNTWILLTAASAPSFNWYQNYQTMFDFNQPGWFDNYGEMKSVKMDISFLKDQSNVIFRYKFYSNFALSGTSTKGFRLDNFSIGQETLVNQLNCFESIPYSMNFDNLEVTCWEIGKNDSSIILLNRNANQDIQWEIADNFANSSGNSSAKIDLNSQGNIQGVWLISPKFNMVEGNKLKFNIALNQLGNFNTSTLDSDDEVKLMYSVNNGLSWTDLKIWNNTSVISNTGQLELINALPVSGYARFAFWATNGALNNGNNTTFYVDDFELYTGSLGISKQETTSLSFYPNPVQDWLHINSSVEQINVAKLYTISGQLLETLNFNNKNISIDFRAYPKGVYFIELNSGDKSKTLKVLK